MKVTITNLPQIENLHKTINKICKTTFKILKQPRNILEIGISFVSKEEMKELNFTHRKIEKATDVLSFPYLDLNTSSKVSKKKFINDFNNDTKKILIGDIIICTEVAEKQAVELGHSLMREISFLTVHGLLHLFGFDHEDEQDRVNMRNMEELVLKKLKLGR